MSANNIEVEIKLRVHSSRYAAQLLSSKGFAIRAPRHLEINVILDSADGVLRSRGELLRLRQVGAQTWLTYKGPADATRHKSREEIEFESSSFTNAGLLLKRLGFRESFRYEKFRTEYYRLGDPGVVTVDETPIGVFLEIEGPATWIDCTARKLGFEESAYITASCGRLYLDWCRERNISPANMVFATQVPGGE